MSDILTIGAKIITTKNISEKISKAVVTRQFPRKTITNHESRSCANDISDQQLNKMSYKSHCCCCIHLSDGVLLVGIYGCAFHAGFLIIQLTHGHTLTPTSEVDPNSDTIIHPIVVAVHTVGMIANLLLVAGVHWSKRYLMLPWLMSQGFLATILAILALYYLILFPDTECPQMSHWNQPVECHILLWHSVIMILSLLILFYYFYIVYEFVSQLRQENKLDSLITIERKDISDQTSSSIPLDLSESIVKDAKNDSTSVRSIPVPSGDIAEPTLRVLPARNQDFVIEHLSPVLTSEQQEQHQGQQQAQQRQHEQDPQVGYHHNKTVDISEENNSSDTKNMPTYDNIPGVEPHPENSTQGEQTARKPKVEKRRVRIKEPPLD